MRNKSDSYLIITVIFFGIIYTAISLVNHYFFRTAALDLGAYSNALYDYAHFRWNDSTVFKETGENLLADHFDLYLIIFSPLVYLFGTYTLLIVQILFILIGGLGIYQYFKAINTNFALQATIYFYLFFGIFSALAFDFHSNVVAAMLVPWFFYYFKRKSYFLTLFLLILILISKENIALWLAFICLGLIIEYRKDFSALKYLILYFLVAISYFVIITAVVMPSISNEGVYPHIHYSFLGQNSLEVIQFLFTHPLTAIKYLFINHNNSPFGTGVKLEFHVFMLLSGLILLFYKPHYLIMLIPLYAQKMFHDNYIMWGVDKQYAVEFAPIMAIGVFAVLKEIKNKSLKTIIITVVILLAISTTIRLMDNTVIYTGKSHIRIYKASHYTKDYNAKKVHKLLKEIPGDAVLSVQSPFLPHLALRDDIYQFPIMKDAEYIIVSLNEGTYPLTENEFDEKLKALEQDTEWDVIKQTEGLLVFKRKQFHD